MRSERRTVRATLASAEAAARRNPGDPAARARVDQLRAEYRALALEDHIREVVDGHPPLTAEMRDQLALLFRGTSDTGGARGSAA
jgi:hypothetical protein